MKNFNNRLIAISKQTDGRTLCLVKNFCCLLLGLPLLIYAWMHSDGFYSAVILFSLTVTVQVFLFFTASLWRKDRVHPSVFVKALLFIYLFLLVLELAGWIDTMAVGNSWQVCLAAVNTVSVLVFLAYGCTGVYTLISKHGGARLMKIQQQMLNIFPSVRIGFSVMWAIFLAVSLVVFFLLREQMPEEVASMTIYQFLYAVWWVPLLDFSGKLIAVPLESNMKSDIPPADADSDPSGCAPARSVWQLSMRLSRITEFVIVLFWCLLFLCQILLWVGGGKVWPFLVTVIPWVVAFRFIARIRRETKDVSCAIQKGMPLHLAVLAGILCGSVYGIIAADGRLWFILLSTCNLAFCACCLISGFLTLLATRRLWTVQSRGYRILCIFRKLTIAGYLILLVFSVVSMFLWFFDTEYWTSLSGAAVVMGVIAPLHLFLYPVWFLPYMELQFVFRLFQMICIHSRENEAWREAFPEFVHQKGEK